MSGFFVTGFVSTGPNIVQGLMHALPRRPQCLLQPIQNSCYGGGLLQCPSQLMDNETKKPTSPFPAPTRSATAGGRRSGDGKVTCHAGSTTQGGQGHRHAGSTARGEEGEPDPPAVVEWEPDPRVVEKGELDVPDLRSEVGKQAKGHQMRGGGGAPAVGKELRTLSAYRVGPRQS